MSMNSLVCRFFAQNKWPLLIWISARILDVGETSLRIQRDYLVYVVEKPRDIRALGWRPDPIILGV